MGLILQADRNLLLLIQNVIRTPALTPVMKALTHLGDAGVLWIVLTAVLLYVNRTRLLGIASASALVCSLLINNVLLKPLIARVRPFDAIPGLAVLVGKPSDFSFPSGHSAASFASAAAIVFLLHRLGRWSGEERRLGILALTLAALIALSRLYVGVHYPTDVLAGSLSGVLCGALGCRAALFIGRFVCYNRRD